MAIRAMCSVWLRTGNTVGIGDQTTYLLLPPPTDSTTHAALTLQRELRAMLREQEKAEKSNCLKELGWYIPFELMGDNLFRWMLEYLVFQSRRLQRSLMLCLGLYARLHSVDPALPIAQDMVRQ